MKQSNVKYNNVTRKPERRVTLIEQYYNRIKPDMEFSEFQKICETPFRHLKAGMMSGEVYDYRYSFFGDIVPRPATVVWLLKDIKKRYREQRMTQTEYNKYIGGIVRYISRKAPDYKRYAEDIKEFIDIT
jgi:hypothetical protein